VFELTCRSPEATALFAGHVARVLQAGDLICLYGDLGAGKTTFTRALVNALGSPALVSSPTFTIIHEYPGGRLPVYHVDAYRLVGPDDVLHTGLHDYLAGADGVTVVEWPERIASALPPERLTISLDDIGGDDRRIIITAEGDIWAARLAELREAVEAC
jgi:tRNA threonylcarbamoyladenosine biosynthesis protein TsaE